MSNRMWENTVEHAKTCVLGGKLYVYYTDAVHHTGVVFNHIYELRGLVNDGQFFSLESLTHSQKVSCLHSEILALIYITYCLKIIVFTCMFICSNEQFLKRGFQNE